MDVSVNARNNYILTTTKTFNANTLLPFTQHINNAIKDLDNTASSVHIQEKWTKIMTHSVNQEDFPDTPTGMDLLRQEIEEFNNFNIRYWSRNYRGCWLQTCPPIVPR